MKKVVLLCLMVLLVLPLWGCSSETVYTVNRNGTAYEVNKEAGTISDGKYTYQYTFSGNSKEYDLTIEYPNGSTYWWEQRSSGVGYGGWSEGYDESAYADGDTLRNVLQVKAPRSSGENIGVSLLLLAVGVFGVLAPRAAWELSYGWRFKDAEPSDLALLVNRGGGIVAIIAAVVLLFL